MIAKDLISKYFPILILISLWSSFPNLTLGQGTVVKGFVVDQDSKPLKNVKITFLDPAKGFKFVLKSNKEGKFLKIGIPPSSYNIMAELEGYFHLETEFRVRIGENPPLKLTLEKIPPKIEEDKNLAEGMKFFQEAKFEKAIEAFKDAVEKFPGNVEANYSLAISYLRAGHADKAIVYLEKVNELKPDMVEAYFALGECYFNKGGSEKALQAFSKALEFRPDNSRVYFNIGIVYYQNKKTEEAIDFFKKSKELDPNFASAYYQLGLAYINKGDLEKAIENLEKFLSLESEAPEVGATKAIIKELRKQIDRRKNK